MDQRVHVALQILAESLGARRGLARAAATTNLSISRLRHLIKTETRLAPGQHIRLLRMKRAAELLGSTFLRVKEVAVMVGAGDVSHFVRDFKNTFRVTPNNFRRTLRENRASQSPESAADFANNLATIATSRPITSSDHTKY